MHLLQKWKRSMGCKSRLIILVKVILNISLFITACLFYLQPNEKKYHCFYRSIRL